MNILERDGNGHLFSFEMMEYFWSFTSSISAFAEIEDVNYQKVIHLFKNESRLKLYFSCLLKVICPNMSMKQKISIMKDVAAGMGHLNEQGVVHRDLAA